MRVVEHSNIRGFGEEIISNEADRAFTSDTGWWIKGAYRDWETDRKSVV